MKSLFFSMMMVTLLVTSGCHNNTPSEAPEQETRSLQERLKYAPVKSASEKELVTLPAWLTTNVQFQLELSPPAQGKVVALLVTEGSWVDADTPLARLHVPALAGVTHLEAAAKKRLEAANARLKMEEERLAMGMGTRVDLQNASSARAEANMALEQIQARRNASEFSGLSNEGGEGLTRLWRAPRAGVITAVHIHEGQGVSPNDVAFSLVDSKMMEVAARVPERLIANLNSEARLVWRPNGHASEKEGFTLSFSRHDAVVDIVSRTVTCYFKGLPQEGGDVLPGRSGRGTILLPARSGIWQVPRQAVCRLLDKDGVFVAGSDLGKPEFLAVEVLGRIQDDLLIRSSEIQTETQVVVSGTFLLKSIKLLSEES